MSNVTKQNVERLRGAARELMIGDNKLYHKTKYLLEIYSKVSWNVFDRCESYEDKSKIYDIDGIKGIEILSMIGDQNQAKEYESQLRMVGENKMMLELTQNALLHLRKYPQYGKLYYDIIYKNYFVDYKYCESDILLSLNISRSTYYRYRKKAIQLFGVSLWGFILPKVLNMIEKSIS